MRGVVQLLIFTMVMIGMLSNLVEPAICAALTTASAVVITLCIQWARFIDHKKTSKSDDELKNRFAWFQYGILPVAFSMFAVLLGLFGTDILVAKGYVFGAEECAFASVIITVLGMMVVDKAFRIVSDAAYFTMIEDEFLNKAVEPVAKDASEMTAAELLEIILKKK